MQPRSVGRPNIPSMSLKHTCRKMLTVYLFTVHRSQSLSAPNEQPYSARWNLDMFSCRLVSKNHAKFHPGFHLYVESVRLDERGKLHVLRVVLCSATYAAGEGKARALLRIYENTRRVVLNSSRTGSGGCARCVEQQQQQQRTASRWRGERGAGP